MKKYIESIFTKIIAFAKKIPNSIQYILNILFNIIIIIAILTAIRTFIFLPFNVDGVSMQPTLENKELIYVDKLIPSLLGYKHGNVIVFTPPSQNGIIKKILETGAICYLDQAKNLLFFQKKENPCYVPATYVKRIIATPGDSVKIKNGYAYVNDQKIHENFLLEQNKQKTCVPATKCSRLLPLPSEAEKDFGIVPDNHYFVLGDNRLNSSDSRASSWDTPFIHEKQIIGIVRAVYLSPIEIINQGSAFANYWESIKNIPSSFRHVRFIGNENIYNIK